MLSDTEINLIAIGIFAFFIVLYIFVPRFYYNAVEKFMDMIHNDQIKDKETAFAQSGRLADRYAHLQSVSGGSPAGAPPAQMPVPEAAPAPGPMPAEQSAPPASAAAEPALRKFCPYCGTENEYDARFCHRCGAALPDLEDLE